MFLYIPFFRFVVLHISATPILMIKIDHLSYGYKAKEPIFNNISLEISNGIYGLLGDNGAGKTTLMHLICGLLFPQKGTCTLNERHLTERTPEMLGNYFFLPEEMLIPEGNIISFARKHSVFYPNFQYKEFEQNLKELQIDGHCKLSSVSYGEQKKAMLAYALALHTSLTVLDEPTNGLDISSRHVLKKIIARSTDESSCLIISTHQARDFEHLLDHLIILGKGKILLNHSIDEISEHLLFTWTDTLPQHTVYSEENLQGYMSIRPNEKHEENTPDIELLYNAIHIKPEQIKQLFL